MSIVQSDPRTTHAPWCTLHPDDNPACASDLVGVKNIGAWAIDGPNGPEFTIEGASYDLTGDEMDDLIARLVALRERVR